MKLNREEVDKIFKDCLFEDEEIIDGFPNSDFTSVENINSDIKLTICFNTNKLNKNKNSIIELIEQLPKIDEGTDIDNLYFDKYSNQWCKDIYYLDKLLTMALACQIISYNTIIDNKKNIIIIKRTKENDNKEVKGINPYKTKNNNTQISKQYTDEEKEIINNNKIRISLELKMYKEIINLGLSFFGIHANINEIEKQIDFYDKNNNLLFKRKFKDTDGITGWEGVFNQRLKCEFDDSYSNKITYLDDEKRHIFLLSAKEYGYRIEIAYDNKTRKYNSIEIITEDPKDDYIIKNLFISNNYLKIELNNQFGPNGNYEDGILRKIQFTPNEYLFITEDEWFEKGHHLIIDKSKIRVDKETLIERSTNLEFSYITTSILSHPRNKELLEFTLTELNKKLPGIKKFIINNFPLYNYLTNLEYKKDELTEQIVQAVTHEKCNLKENNKLKLK